MRKSVLMAFALMGLSEKVISQCSVTPAVGILNHVSCFGGSDGSLVIGYTGGTGPFQYQLDTGPTLSSPNFSGLSAGTYTCWIYDMGEGFCGESVNVTITQPPSGVSVSISTMNATCSGSCDGVVTASVSGGTAPYTFMWEFSTDMGTTWINLGVTTSSLTGVCAGMYRVYVIDANGCSVMSSPGTVNEGIVLSTSATVSPSATCSPCNGTIEFDVSGGTPPYTYSVDGGVSFYTDTLFTGICPGAYNLVVQDAVGCNTAQSATIAASPVPGMTVSSIIANETGAGINDGAINLAISGTSSPLTFQWSNGAFTEDIYSLSDGIYWVVITDTNGNCNTYNYNVYVNMGNVMGQVYVDIDNSCSYNAGDYPLSYVQVTASPGAHTTYSSATGNYAFALPVSTYNIQPVLASFFAISSSCPINDTVTLSTSATVISDFPIEVISPAIDASVSSFISPITPGFPGSVVTTLNNNGSIPYNGTLYIIVPDTVTYTGASPAPAAINGDTLVYNITGHIPGTTLLFYLNFICPPDPSLLGFSTCMNSWIATTSGTDAVPANNNSNHCRTILGSYDPNDKSVNPAGDVFLTDSLFTYLIRFQNTGTAPAININVRDTLSDFLDPSTIELLGSSHPCSFILLDNKIMRWDFDGIMLPDSTSDEPGSHGWILFRIQSKNTVMIGDVVENTADIYFDFNPPVITNTTMNGYVVPGTIESIVRPNALQLYPNPARESITVYMNSIPTQPLVILDIHGRIVQNISSNRQVTAIHIGNLEKGIYLITCGNIVQKFVKE